MDYVSLLGFVAGSVTVVSFIPQVLRVWRTRQTRDLSMGTFVLLASGAALWLLYGVLTRDWPVIATNVAVGVLVLGIVAAKVRIESRAVPPPLP